VYDDDVLFQTVAELSAGIRARRLSPVELTESYLHRIQALNGRLNAFTTVTADLAREQARAAEREIARGRWRGPLHGVPYGAKDLLATVGTRTTWGAAPCREQRFERDATVVRRLREAGAVLLGKTAMIEFAGGLGYRFANASLDGPSRNPWDTGRWTGGSSSGSGAAVAAALCGFAIGTETWGSILCPSAFCGVTGLRPTYGRVSRAGAMACSYSFDKIGPMARSAEDCRLVLGAIAGRDPEDATTTDEPPGLSPNRAPRPLSRLRLAQVSMDFSKGGQASAGRAFEAAVLELRAMGASLVEETLPAMPIAEAAGIIITAEALAAFAPFFGDGRVKQLRDVYAPHQPEINAAVTGADLVRAWRVRTAAQRAMADLFGRYDALVTPNFLSVAPPVEQDLYEALPYGDPVGAFGNACGLPSLALPCGTGDARMPVGFQVMGAAYDEATVLEIGEAWQKRTRFHRARPPLRETGIDAPAAD
jgi:aspartyl-tRNA(Asn)/glutamyl-tRNA(Gln) amidotransferase subunit A